MKEIKEENRTRRPEDGTKLLELRASADEAPVVKLVHSLIADAVTRGASDIHFDPSRGAMQIR